MSRIFGTFENFQDVKEILLKYEEICLWTARDYHDHVLMEVSTRHSDYFRLIEELENLNYEIKEDSFLWDAMDSANFIVKKRI